MRQPRMEWSGATMLSNRRLAVGPEGGPSDDGVGGGGVGEVAMGPPRAQARR